MLRILYFICNCFLTPFFNKPGSSKDLTIYMISFISSFKIIDAVTLDQRVILHIPAFAADIAVVNRNSIKMLLANGLSTFFKVHLFFIIGKNVHLNIFWVALFQTPEFLIVLH